ncbi:MAG: DUF3987 domain-containing protein [Phycisphaerales bacterium]|nr:DUF3987 domain-containing protein [Phycisphaerales bacterium]
MISEQDTLHSAAMDYLAAGLCALPARRAEKRPAVGQWKRYRKRLPTESEVSAWFANGPDALCIICGVVSGHAEMIDFDAGGELFETWAARIPPDLLAKLVIEKTQSGGYHVIYRYEGGVCGNMKLAQRRDADKIVTLIETRGEGGLFLCTPTPGYAVVQGDLCDLPVLTEAQRDLLLRTAWELNEYLPPVVDCPPHNGVVGQRGPSSAAQSACASHNADRPGDDFNRRGDVRAVLAQHGWSLAKSGENEYWLRPGKASGWSASLKDGVFYVFSANAAPFEPNRAYSPFSVYTLLNHGGDWAQAAGSLRLSGYGGDSLANNAHGADISAIVRMSAAPGACSPNNGDIGQTMALCGGQAARAPEIPDPGPMPPEMLRVPGFISEVMDHTLAIAPYPNPVMAFAGALALQAVLAGRKVRDPGDNRTNIYLLGLAHSSAGKDQSRKVNNDVLHAVGMADCLGLHFASGEGLQDALFQTPSMLFQTDEIDGMLQSINKAKDARHEAIMGTMLTMYSSANSVFPMRRKAGKESPGVIDQPCLVIYGTAIPNHYYEALSERMLTNGFFARMIILESGPRPEGQEPGLDPPPPRVLATAKWWADYQPGERRGNLLDIHPVPAVVEHTDEARRLLIETRKAAEAEYTNAEAKSDPVGTTVWGRVSEQTRKLALLYAISENHRSPRIGLAAVEWASAFVMHQTRRMLFMAAGHVAENPFHAECLKAVEKLRSAPGNELPHSVLLKRMKMDSKSFGMLVETLVQQGDIEITTTAKPGWPIRSYRLAGGVNLQGETSPGGES